MTLFGVDYRRWRFDMIWDSMYGLTEDYLEDEYGDEEDVENTPS